MYTAYIVKINELRKHSNADRLQVANIFDCNVIVDMNTKVGDIGIFFPVDGQLSKAYCEQNNLCRKKDENGKNIGGYLDEDKRCVRAMGLRGERSEGLFMPLTSLEKFCDISTLNVGDQITTINGNEICCKYIPKSVNRHTPNNSKSRRFKANKQKLEKRYPFFAEHIDTPQLKYNPDMFKPGELIIMTEKLHGCFRQDTKVNLWGQPRSKPISQIKVGDIVIGYKDGKFVPSRVVNTFINGETDVWRDIRVSNNFLRGDNRRRIVCTPEHLFYKKEIENYVHASELNVGDTVCTAIPTEILSERAKAIFIGNILGDGSISSNCKHMDISQKIDREEYLDYLVDIYNGLLYKNSKIYISGYGTQMLRCRSKNMVDLIRFKSECFSNGENKLSRNIIKYFNWDSLALLYMDDGSLSHNELQQDRANIAICDYNEHDSKIIVECLNKLGLNPVYYVDSRGYSRIRLNKDDAKMMFDNIYSLVPNVMRYKLPAEYRDKEFIGIAPIEREFGYVYMENTIISNTEINGEINRKYDIETETHNYCVNNTLVHNSSGRISRTLVRNNNLLSKIFKRPKYEYVGGTRRRIRSKGDSGYYGDEAFRDKWEDFFKGKLQKGETIYGEIVGFTEKNSPIMGRGDNTKLNDKDFVKRYGKTTTFSYGCDEDKGENDFYIYRITKTDEDGNVIEYPYDYIKIRAEQMGAKVVPEFERFIYTTHEDMMERVNKYLEGCSTIDSSHTREGIVLRADRADRYKVAKIKSYAFSVLEGLIKENADAPDMEEAQEV